MTRFFIGGALLILLIFAGVNYMTRRAAWADLSKFDQVRPGLTALEVDSLLVGRSSDGPLHDGQRSKQWYGLEAVVTVWFDDDGRVTKTKLQKVTY